MAARLKKPVLKTKISVSKALKAPKGPKAPKIKINMGKVRSPKVKFL